MHLPKAPAEGLTTPRLGKGGRTAPDFRGNHVGEAEKRRDRGGGTGHGGVGRGEGGGQAESLGCGVHSALFGVLSFRKPKCYHIPKWAKGTLNRALDGWLNVSNNIQHYQKGRTGVFLNSHSLPPLAIPRSLPEFTVAGVYLFHTHFFTQASRSNTMATSLSVSGKVTPPSAKKVIPLTCFLLPKICIQ